MDASALYSMYTETMSDGKLEVLRIFIGTLIENPILALFVTCLLIKDIKKTATAFIKYFV